MLKNKNVLCKIANVSIAMKVADLGLPSEKLHGTIRRDMRHLCLCKVFSVGACPHPFRRSPSSTARH